MSKVLDGIGASEGIGAGRVHILNWGVPEVPRRSIDADEVEGEVEHLLEVFEWAKTRILVIEDSTEERLGAVGGENLRAAASYVGGPRVD